jgi:hypothetical protein
LTALTSFEKLCGMARSIRIEFEVALYHIMARGNLREAGKSSKVTKRRRSFGPNILRNGENSNNYQPGTNGAKIRRIWEDFRGRFYGGEESRFPFGAWS